MADLPSGTVTFLFTDLEDSTRLWQEHPDAMREALARHDAILREAIESHNGHLVKTTGDGALAAFSTASDAIGAAVGGQLAVTAEEWNLPEPLRVRIGINTGPAELRDADYHGTAVNRAARIMSIAHGGQTLVSLATSELARDTSLEFLDLGEHRLRGLDRAERVFQLQIPGLPSEFALLTSRDPSVAPMRMPAPTFACGDEAFAGRATALVQLESAWRRARDGLLQIALVGGEPGVGKTRLAAELALHVSTDQAAVLYGRCDEETVVPYQPFIEALRPCVAVLEPSTLNQQLHGLGGDLVRVFPELAGRVAARAPSPAETLGAGWLDDARAADRYRLFEGLTALLAGIATSQPVLLVLDDLHWADKPTVLLYRHVLRGLTHTPLLVLGCYRDVDLPGNRPVTDLLADLRRERAVTWLALDGLSEAESEELLRSRAGRRVAPPLVKALHQETDGNPFFLEAMLRHLSETGAAGLFDDAAGATLNVDDLDLPDTVRDVVVRRVHRLPAPVDDVLSVAAVVGREFEPALLARAAGLLVADVLAALDRAVAAGLVGEDAQQPGRYVFSHALIRQALYADLARAQRTRLHHEVGVAMEAEGAHRYPPATLAHHFFHAIALGDAERAITFAIAAGREAAANLVFEEAVKFFDQALELLDRQPAADTTMRAVLLIDRAEALVYLDEGAGVEAALQAVDASRATGSPLQFGRAVAVFVEPALAAALYPREAAALFDEAMSVLGDDEPTLRARLLAILAFKYATAQLRGRDGRSLADTALRTARATSDPLTLADALLARAVSLEGLADLAERVALGEELVELGRTSGARPLSYGLGILAGVQLAAGDADALSATVARQKRVGETMHWLPAHVHAARWEATRALLEGRFGDARDTAKEMRQYVSAYRGTAGIRGAILFHVAREQGELSDSLIDVPLTEQRDNLHGLVMISLAQLDSGELTATLDELDAVARDDGTAAADQPAWPALLAVLTEAAASAGDGTHASYLSTRLEPFAGRLLTMPTGLAALGAADRYLAMLAALLANWDEAEVRFDRALDLEQRARGWALLPRTRYWQARFLRARDAAGDGAAADAALREVDAETTRLGMARLRAQAAQLTSA